MAVNAVGLGKTEFLNLLATQLRNQNPMNPMDNTQFIAQLAQFSALEAAENTNTSVEKMNVEQLRSQATSLIGHNVAGLRASDHQAFTGKVTSVDVSSDVPVLYLGTTMIYLDDIVAIS